MDYFNLTWALYLYGPAVLAGLALIVALVYVLRFACPWIADFIEARYPSSVPTSRLGFVAIVPLLTVAGYAVSLFRSVGAGASALTSAYASIASAVAGLVPAVFDGLKHPLGAVVILGPIIGVVCYFQGAASIAEAMKVEQEKVRELRQEVKAAATKIADLEKRVPKPKPPGKNSRT